MAQIRLVFLTIFFISCQKAPSVTKLEYVKKGVDIENIEVVSVNKFFNLWINNRIRKTESKLEELYKDSTYTYFGKQKVGLVHPSSQVLKVNSDSLAIQLPNYKELNGFRLMHYLWENVVPIEDKESWTNSKCSGSRAFRKYKYSLNEKKVILTMNWEIKSCKELQKLKDKKYLVEYNLLTKKIEGKTTTNNN